MVVRPEDANLRQVQLMINRTSKKGRDKRTGARP